MNRSKDNEDDNERRRGKKGAIMKRKGRLLPDTFSVRKIRNQVHRVSYTHPFGTNATTACDGLDVRCSYSFMPVTAYSKRQKAGTMRAKQNLLKLR
jgi:hypothetical protein